MGRNVHGNDGEYECMWLIYEGWNDGGTSACDSMVIACAKGECMWLQGFVLGDGCMLSDK